MSLTVIIPTRDRPQLLLKTMASAIVNSVNHDTRILVCVDEDDTPTIDALAHALSGVKPDGRLCISVKPREDSRGEKYDRALTEAPGSVYLLGVDAAPIMTKGYDQLILDAASLFPDNIGCVYAPMANASFPSYQAPTAGLVKRLGGCYSREYAFWFVDHELDDICRMIGRYVCVDINVDCHSMRPGKTLRLRELEFWTTYFDLMTLERRLKARDIIMSPDFQAPDWQKTVLCNSYQPIESRSYWINSNVRNNAAYIEKQRGDPGPPDEGYLRVKRKAENKLTNTLAALRAAAA